MDFFIFKGMIFKLEKAIFFSLLFSGKINLNKEIFLKMRKTRYRGRSPQLEVFHSGVFTSQKRLCAADLPGCSCSQGLWRADGAHGAGSGTQVQGWAGVSVQSTGQVVSKVLVMSWWWRRAARTFPVFISHNIVIVVAFQWKKGEILTHVSSAGISSICPGDWNLHYIWLILPSLVHKPAWMQDHVPSRAPLNKQYSVKMKLLLLPVFPFLPFLSYLTAS